MTKNISILGSTGSIGTQTLEVIQDLESIRVLGLTTNTGIDLLEKQIERFNPVKVAVMDREKAKILKDRIKNKKVQVLAGIEGIIEVALIDEADTVLNALVGNIGLRPTISAIRAKKNIALANKETLVTAGQLVIDEAEKNNVKLYPIDSEHSAVFQCLQGMASGGSESINKIILTASGGPFRNKTLEELKRVTIEDALNHPNWSMGKKITIDSATMMNKGLEVIEAKWLFGVALEKIEVVVHPQSIIHSMVEFTDSAIIAQLGEPDMKVPIQYALTYPLRIKNSYPKLNLFEKNNLTFEKPDLDKFSCLRLAFLAIGEGGTLPTVLNGANEIAVKKFLDGTISFLDIPVLIEKTMEQHINKLNFTLEDVFEADSWSREFAEKISI